MKKPILLLLAAVLLFSGCAGLAECKKPYIKDNGSCCLDENNDNICDSSQSTGSTLFDSVKNKSSQRLCQAASPVLYTDSSNNIAYFFDNFAAYAGNQITIDGFEDPSSWSLNGQPNQLQLSDDYYGGSGSLSFDAPAGMGSMELEKDFAEPLSLSRFQKSGYATMWLKIEDPKGIDSATLKLVDSSGNSRTYAPLANVHTDLPNTFDDDPYFPDLIYPKEDRDSFQWTDYVLSQGWNYLPFRMDQFNDSGPVDLSKAAKVHLTLNLTKGHAQRILFNDLRAQDGLQRRSNPTAGIWHPPLGRPQYGVYDLDTASNGSSELRILNIRNTQYPSNGDHARMLTYANMPLDFALRVRFRVLGLGENRNNTYMRVSYDFEPDWDPGHDWFGTYVSLQYNKFGLMSVKPVKRKEQQEQEPLSGSPTASDAFTPKENATYQLDLVALGQSAFANIYGVNGSSFTEMASVKYTFNRERYGWDRRYPLSIESTGNMRLAVQQVEVVSLDSPAACSANQSTSSHLVQQNASQPQEQNASPSQNVPIPAIAPSLSPLGSIRLSQNASGEGALFEDFEEISTWSLSGTGSKQPDTINARQGKQSLLLSSQDNSPVIATKPIFGDFSNTKNFLIWAYVPFQPISSSPAFELQFSPQGGFSSYYSARISWSHLRKGWNKIVVAKSRFSQTGDASWNSPMQRLKLIFRPYSSGQSISFDELRTDYAGGRAPKAQVIMTFDDGWDSVFTAAKPIMDANSQKGVAFIPTDLTGTPGYMTKDNLASLYRSGWDISSHTVSHVDLNSVGISELDSQLSQSRAILESWGFNRSSKFIAYPMNYYNDLVVNETKKYYSLARDGMSSLEQPHFYSTDSDLPYTIKASTVGNYTTVAAAKEMIDYQIGQKGLLILVWHRLVEDKADASSKYFTKDFREISDYLKQKQDQGLLDIATFSEYFNSYVKENKSAERQ